MRRLPCTKSRGGGGGSGARRMQELKYFGDGATLVISLDGLNWISKRRCSDKGIKKRNEELQLLIFAGEMIQADEELQAIACVLDQRGSASSQLCRNRDTGWHISDDNALSAAHGPNTSNSKGNQHELVVRDNFHNLKSRLESCHIYAPGVSSGSDANVKKRKSVSFEDDVMVYLFDQESPTLELHSEAYTSLPDVTFEDSGLEWDDDFSALEKNGHFQCVRRSQQHTSSLPTQSSTALSRRFLLSQTCLFLTHVTESDLEL
ncbi:hypothetical protein VZT92_012114 [Zoarces viviparus]|uniref:Uncharacterized protein n=1 Tax=Zoarces viviparus TaxID=48416 RepID=A0AAW1F7N8_ZOAVI